MEDRVRPEPGVVVSRFVLVARLGSGGMGQVWKARDPQLGRDVAIKLLPDTVAASPERRRRFEAEARAAATVRHPNVATVYDSGEWNGVPFIVQEFVEGRSVGDLLAAEKSFPATRVAEWGAQAADALAGAHAAGVLHRDVKPANLLVGPSGRLQVVDFGLARVLREDEAASDRLTRDGIVVGTAEYMSPEQALGRAIEERSDQFSLGLVLWEMSTGRRAFEAPTPLEEMHAIAYDPLPPFPDGLGVGTSGLGAVLGRMLAKKPEDRYPSMSDVAEGLRTSLGSAATEPHIRVPGSSPGNTARLPRSGAWNRGKTAAACAAAGVLAAVGAYLARPSEPVIVLPSRTNILTPLETRDEWPAYSPDGKSFIYASNRSGGSHIFLQLLSGGAVVPLTVGEGLDRQPAYSPDGSSVLFTRLDPRSGAPSLWRVPSVGGPPRMVLDRAEQGSYSLDGKRIAFVRRIGDRYHLGVLDAEGAEPRFIVDTGPRGEAVSPTFSPDGRWIAFVWRDCFPNGLGDVWRVRPEGGTPEQLTRDRKDTWPGIAFLASGRFLLYTAVRSGISGVLMIPAEGRTAPRHVLGGAAFLEKPSLSPDGHSLLVQTMKHSSDAWLFPLDGGPPRSLTKLGTVWGPVFLPDGRLVYGDWVRQGVETDLVVESGTGSRTVLGEGVNARPSRDGRQLYFSRIDVEGRRVLGVLPLDGGPTRWLTKPEGVDEYPDPEPDGRHLVFCRNRPGAGSGLYRLDLRDGAEKLLLSGEVTVSRAGPGGVAFRSCREGGCGVWTLPWGTSQPSLVVPDGEWPVVSADGATIWAWRGPKNNPVLVEAPFDGHRPPRELFSLPAASRDRSFWCVYTMAVTPDGRSLIVTYQRRQDDVVLFEGVLR